MSGISHLVLVIAALVSTVAIVVAVAVGLNIIVYSVMDDSQLTETELAVDSHAATLVVAQSND